jgi:hypothetical protein
MNFIKDPLLGEYFIQIDEYNYSVYKTIMPDSGTPYDSCIGHCSSLEAALNKIVDNKMKQSSYTSIKDYIIELRNIKNEFKQHFL